MAIFYTSAELQGQRKKALREVRRRQRAADTAVEKLERRIFRLLDRKTLISSESMETLIPLWNEFIKNVRDLEHGIADAISITYI